MGKKIFEGTEPIMQFISKPQEETPVQKIGEVPAGYRLNPAFIEKKNRRLQLLIQPSLFLKAKKIADSKGISFNEFVRHAIETAVKEEGAE